MSQSFPSFVAALPAARRADAVFEYARQRFREADGPDWLRALDTACTEVAQLLTREQWRVLASDLAWWTRQRRDDDGPDRSPRAEIVFGDDSPIARLVTAQFLRFDFRFDDLIRYLRPVAHPDALYSALLIFGRLGTGQSVTVDAIEAVRSARDSDNKVLHCLLHGLCICADPAPWANLIVEIGDELERTQHPSDPVLFYRRAIGHRLLGEMKLADTDVRRALSLVPPDNSVHQQLNSELTAIASERQVMSTIAAQERAFLSRIEAVRSETLEEIERSLRSGLIANFQILAIFLSLATFVGTAGATVIRLAEDRISWGRGVATLSVLLVFTFAVFIGSRVLIEANFRRRNR